MAETGGIEGEIPTTPPEDSGGAATSPSEEGTSRRSRAKAGEAASKSSEAPPPETPPPGDGDDGEEEESGYKGRDMFFGRASEQWYRDEYKRDRAKFEKEFRALQPHSTYLDEALAAFIAKLPGEKGDKLVDFMLKKIITQPLDLETSNYSLGLPAQSSLATLTSALQEAAATIPGLKARYNNALESQAAVELFHSMNKNIVTAAINRFGEQAEGITPDQQQVLQNVKGAAQVMRLFEDEYARILVEDDWVSNEASDKMMGKIREKGVHAKDEPARLAGSVEGRLKALVEFAKEADKEGRDLPPALQALKDLEDWEVRWAFNAGRLLHNISLRAAEVISLSKVPEGSEAWKSIPQEAAARLMNQLNWVNLRFSKGKVRGGIEFVKGAQRHYQALRRQHGYGETRITKLARKNIEDYEVAGMFKVSGIFSTWRNKAMIIDHTPIAMHEGNTVGLYTKAIKDNIELEIQMKFGKDIADQVREMLGLKEGEEKSDERFKTLFKAKFAEKLAKDKSFNQEFEKAKKDAEPRILRETYLTSDGQLRKEFTNSLGVLLRDISSAEKDIQVPGLIDAKQDVRAAIWRKVAEENPMGIAFFMAGMEFKDGKSPDLGGRSLDDFRLFSDKLTRTETKDKTTGKPTLTTWGDLREKLMIAREIRLAGLVKETPEIRGLRDILQHDMGVDEDSPEWKFLDDIEHYGKCVAGDLASVRLPFNPFMNDVVFEQIEYNEAGNQYYNRRMGDIGAIQESYKAFNTVASDPAGISREDALKAVREAIVALDGPNGWDAAQDEALPFFMSLLDFWEMGGEKSGIAKWLVKDNLYGPLARALKIPNSLAQKYGGTGAIAYDEFEMRGLLDEAYTLGITRKSITGKDGYIEFTDIDDFLRKKKNVKWNNMLLAMLRDFTKIVFAASVYQAFKEVRKPEGK